MIKKITAKMLPMMTPMYDSVRPMAAAPSTSFSGKPVLDIYSLKRLNVGFVLVVQEKESHREDTIFIQRKAPNGQREGLCEGLRATHCCSHTS